MNVERYKLVLKHIEDNPENWDQTQWHCGTSHCFGGWAQILAGKPADSLTVRRDAREFLGLNAKEANYLFDQNRTLNDFRNELIYGSDGFNLNGYRRDGFDHDGYSRNGYDRNGYDRAGYDDDGLDFHNRSEG